MEIDFNRSVKRGIDSEEGYIVFRGNEVFLRLVGGPRDFHLMTATAGEDNRKMVACRDQRRLQEAANATAQELGFPTLKKEDRLGRPYIMFYSFQLLDKAGSTRLQAAEVLESVSLTFFKHFDGLNSPNDDGSELRDIYDELAPDDSGADIYLSDGVWLSASGSLHDQGR